MATSDLKERFKSAMAGYDEENYPQQRRWELEELLLEDQLPLVFTLHANTVLAGRVGGRFPRETYRLAAEQTFSEVSAIVSRSKSGPEDREIEVRRLADVRKVLDVLVEKQRGEDPGPRAAQQPTTGSTKNGQITKE